MARKYSFIFFISIIINILQQGIFSRILVLNYGFDSVFVFLICFALLNNEIDSIILALFCGLIRDSFFPYVFGINSILYILSVFLITQINKRIYKNAIIIPISLTFAFSILKGLLYYAYLYISSIKFNFIDKTLNIIIFESFFNAFACIFIYRLVKWVINLKIMKRDWKF